jgi:hypothetical protein
MDFVSLQHIKARRSTCRGLYLPATFRLQGLATLLTAYSLRARAGFVSHRRRSWDSPFEAYPSEGIRNVSAPNPPTYRFPCRCSQRHSDGPARQAAVPGCCPFRSSLTAGRGFNTPIAGSSPGFRPSRVFQRKPGSGFHLISSHALHELAINRPSAAPQSIDRPSHGPPDRRSELR